MEDPPRYGDEHQGDREHEITCYRPFGGEGKGQETKHQFASERIGHDKSLHFRMALAVGSAECLDEDLRR